MAKDEILEATYQIILMLFLVISISLVKEQNDRRSNLQASTLETIY